jgi:hypothetical protein
MYWPKRIKVSLGTSADKEGAMVVVCTAEKKIPSQKRCHEQSPQTKRNGDTLLGYMGRTALRRVQCDIPLKAGIS